MVSLNPNHLSLSSAPSELRAVGGGGGGGFYLEEDPVIHSGNGLDESSKKARKPYTITKSRESWTEQEHDKFLEALQLFDRDWKKIEAFIGSKTVIQIRSHAQKYFLKVQKNGTHEHLPPPRPKRKAVHPYPQKATKNAPVISRVEGPFQYSNPLESGHVRTGDSSMLRNSVTCPVVAIQAHSSALLADDIREPPLLNKPCSSTESMPRANATCERINHGNIDRPFRVTPDFSQVYGFIGSVFDPNTSGHLQKLKRMDPIDIETVLCLMKNLSVNLISPEFEGLKSSFSTYDANLDTVKPVVVGASDALCP